MDLEGSVFLFFLNSTEDVGISNTPLKNRMPCFTSGFIWLSLSVGYFFPCCYSWRLFACGRSAPWLQSTTTASISEAAVSLRNGSNMDGCSFRKGACRVGGPPCLSVALLLPASSQALRGPMATARGGSQLYLGGSGHKFWKWLSFLFRSAVKTFGKQGVVLLLVFGFVMLVWGLVGWFGLRTLYCFLFYPGGSEYQSYHWSQ